MNAAASRMARPELAAVRECPERHNIRVRPAVLIFGCRFAQEIERLGNRRGMSPSDEIRQRARQMKSHCLELRF